MATMKNKPTSADVARNVTQNTEDLYNKALVDRAFAAGSIDTTKLAPGDLAVTGNLDVTSSGAVDAVLTLERGDDANAQVTITQTATAVDIDYGTSDTVLTINQAGADVDLVVEGDTDVRLLAVNAGLDSVGIGVLATDATAKFQVDSTTKGFLLPRMTTAQRDAIASPAAALMIYNTTTNKLNVFTTTWEVITSA